MKAKTSILEVLNYLVELFGHDVMDVAYSKLISWKYNPPPPQKKKKKKKKSSHTHTRHELKFHSCIACVSESNSLKLTYCY